VIAKPTRHHYERDREIARILDVGSGILASTSH
jgi:hypothetical protein